MSESKVTMAQRDESLAAVITTRELASALGITPQGALRLIKVHGVAYRVADGRQFLLSVDSAFANLPTQYKDRLGKWYDSFLSGCGSREEES